MPENIPVVKKAFHEAGDWGHKGNAGFTPCFLFNLLQQAIGRRVEETNTIYNSWAFPGHQSEVPEPVGLVMDLETADLPHCSLTWGRAQTAGFYSMQQKAKTRWLLNWQEQMSILSIFLCKFLRMPMNWGRGFKAPALLVYAMRFVLKQQLSESPLRMDLALQLAVYLYHCSRGILGKHTNQPFHVNQEKVLTSLEGPVWRAVSESRS